MNSKAFKETVAITVDGPTTDKHPLILSLILWNDQYYSLNGPWDNVLKALMIENFTIIQSYSVTQGVDFGYPYYSVLYRYNSLTMELMQYIGKLFSCKLQTTSIKYQQ